MDYGKTAYLKVLDLEKNVNFSTQSTDFINNYLEISRPDVNQTFYESYPINYELPNINVVKDKSICFQIKITLESSINNQADFELLVNNSIVHHENKVLYKGETDVIILKTYTPLSSGELSVSLNASTNTDTASVNIKSLTLIVLGAEGRTISSEIELNAIDLQNGKTLISFIDGNKLYYTISSLTDKAFKYEDFTYLMPAKSHCFCLEKYPDDSIPSIILYRVDINGNLYMSKILDGEAETLIDINVEKVHAMPCPQVSDDTNIIAYIKEGRCYFRTIRENSILSEKELILPAGKYIDLHVITNPDCEFVYIIACHENGSNYIIRSLVEVSTGKITEFLNASYMLTITKYVDLSFLDKISIENISLSATLDVEVIKTTNDFIENLSKEKLSLDCSLKAETYDTSPATTYSVRLDKSVLKGISWGTYEDDCADLEPAYMDFTNLKFIDNGWTDRWPYNEIKPCLIKNGKVVGYLNPNNYAQFEDGTDAPITDWNEGMVYIEIPKIYFNITRTEEDILFQISNKAQDGFICTPFVYKGEELDKIYVCAYLSHPQNVDSNGFLVASGNAVYNNYAISYESKYSMLKKYNGERCEFLPYNVVILLQCLFVIMFRSTNSQASLGFGYNEAQKSYVTGKLNTAGMYYGVGTSGKGTKFLGLEDLYACRQTLVTGFYISIDENNVYHPRFIDVYNPNSSYAPEDIESYITSDKEFLMGGTSTRAAMDINEDAKHVGFFARGDAYGINRNNGFCDFSYQTRKASSCCAYSTPSTTISNGIFSMSTLPVNSYDTMYAARVVYYPETIGEN